MYCKTPCKIWNVCQKYKCFRDLPGKLQHAFWPEYRTHVGKSALKAGLESILRTMEKEIWNIICIDYMISTKTDVLLNIFQSVNFKEKLEREVVSLCDTVAIFFQTLEACL